MQSPSDTGTKTLDGTQVSEDHEGARLLKHRQRVAVIQGVDRGLQRDIRSNRVTIGQAANNRLVLTDPKVSRRHCEIAVEGERYVIRDLGSTNGTFVNGMSIKEAHLPPRARIRLGDTELRFEPKRKWVPVAPMESDHFGALCGKAEITRTVFDLMDKIASTDLTCVLTGETGTGKELAARTIHEASERADKPIVVLDGASVSETLIASELFGHERGAFTGADSARAGVFEIAHQGTVFIDEIGELPWDLQAKLLRVVQQGEIKRLGAEQSIEIDVRIIAATHRDLSRMVAAGTFREDLYYRLAEVVIQLPPLRDRPEDIPLLAQRFVEQEGERNQQMCTLDPEAARVLQKQDWPGNVRELRNVVRRAVLLGGGTSLTEEKVRDAMAGPAAVHASDEPSSAADEAYIDEDLPLKEARDKWSAPYERAYLVRLVERANGDLDSAAQQAGVHIKSFERLLRKHGLNPVELRKPS